MSAGRLTVAHLGGDAFAIDVAGHRVVVDQPASEGGADRGPTRTELFVGSLAACAAFFAGRFLRRHTPEGTALRVGCEFEMSDGRPSRVRRIDLTVIVGAPLSDDLRAGVLRAVERCTVQRSLRQAPEVGVSLETPVPIPA